MVHLQAARLNVIELMFAMKLRTRVLHSDPACQLNRAGCVDPPLAKTLHVPALRHVTDTSTHLIVFGSFYWPIGFMALVS